METGMMGETWQESEPLESTAWDYNREIRFTITKVNQMISRLDWKEKQAKQCMVRKRWIDGRCHTQTWATCELSLPEGQLDCYTVCGLPD